MIAPRRLDLGRILDQINRVEESIKFTVELEIDNKLPYLDVLLIKDNNKLKFKVFKKPTCKNDYVHFYSDTNCKTKSGIVIGFYLRALRICSEEYLEEEFNNIFHSFIDLKYPPYFILKARNKAKQIYLRNNTKEDCDRRVVLPKSCVAQNISPWLSKANINIVQTSSLTIGNLVKKGKKNINRDVRKACVYQIPCQNCDKVYIGETFRGIETRLKEHRYDMRCFNVNNAIVNHRLDTSHIVDWKSAKVLSYENNISKRRCIESAHIATCNNFNQNKGFFIIAKPLAHLLMRTKPG